MNTTFVSVIIPTYNEELYISKTLDNIVSQDYPKNRLEVIIVDGESTDNTKEIAREYSNNYPYITLINNPQRIVPYALNLGIKSSKGEVVIRLDAHSTYQSDYISSLVSQLHRLNADNVGGVWNTLPGNYTIKAKAISIATSHPFGIGNSLHKIGASSIVRTDTVPYGCYRRDVFDRIGLFDTDLVRNQDDEFNGRLIKNGGIIYLIPDIIIDYYARTTFSKTAKMFYQYGLFKPLVNKKLGAPATIRQFFPLIFILGLVVGAGLSLISGFFFKAYFSVIIVYLALSLYFSIKEVFNHSKPLLLLFLPYTFFSIHISYGIGYLIGLIRFIVLGTNSLSVKSSR